MIKKIISMTLVFVLSLSVCSFCAMADDGDILVAVDGNYIVFDDAKPVIIDGRTMVPARKVFETLGADVDWDDTTKTALFNMDGVKVSVSINNKTLLKNDEKIELDVPAQIINSRTLVPVRAISEAYGCKVDWNDKKKTVVIISDVMETQIATVNDTKISDAYFNLCLVDVEKYYMDYLGCTIDELVAMWNETLDNVVFGDYVLNATVDQIAYVKLNVEKAKKTGIELTQEDMAYVDEVCADIESKLGDEFGSYLKNIGSTREAIKEYYTDYVYVKKYDDVIAKKYAMTDREAKKYIEDNYVQAKHILFATTNTSTGASLSEEEIAKKKALAEETLKKIKSNSGNFDKLMNELSEDTGLSAYPNGYLFTKGEMVEEFEDTAFSLKLNQISGIVESPYGYHIIKRVPVEHGDALTKQIQEVYISKKASEELSSMYSDAEIEKNTALLQMYMPIVVEE